jgi:ligand-binding sensor domain-containing protein
MFKFLLSILLFFFTILPNFSQKPSLIFHNLSIQDGLSENSINAVIEDKKGFMWIATQDGLNKYDGYRFTIYNSNPDDSFSVSHRNAKRLLIARTDFGYVQAVALIFMIQLLMVSTVTKTIDILP